MAKYTSEWSLSDYIKKHDDLLEEVMIRSYTRDILHGLAHLYSTVNLVDVCMMSEYSRQKWRFDVVPFKANRRIASEIKDLSFI